MNLAAEIKKLNFPTDKYILVSGGALGIRGIRETGDIDLVVSPDLFEQCKEAGWQVYPRPNPKDEPGLEKGSVQIFLDVNARGGKFHPTFAELKANQEIIDGIPVCNLQDVIRFKEEYGREKDLKDIELISEYLMRNSS